MYDMYDFLVRMYDTENEKTTLFIQTPKIKKSRCTMYNVQHYEYMHAKYQVAGFQIYIT